MGKLRTYGECFFLDGQSEDETLDFDNAVSFSFGLDTDSYAELYTAVELKVRLDRLVAFNLESESYGKSPETPPTLFYTDCTRKFETVETGFGYRTTAVGNGN